MFQLLSTIDIDTQRKRVVGRVLLLGISSKLTAARERVLRHVLQMHSGVECAGAAETPCEADRLAVPSVVTDKALAVTFGKQHRVPSWSLHPRCCLRTEQRQKTCSAVFLYS
jgi:hypothetical protein